LDFAAFILVLIHVEPKVDDLDTQSREGRPTGPWVCVVQPHWPRALTSWSRGAAGQRLSRVLEFEHGH